jgi:hypothetical protein
MILKAYLDDSEIDQEPVSVLAGWLAPAGSWAPFADEWQRGLEMKPKLKYFKMSECMGFGGEFSGWSRESRNQRLRYFVNLIEEYKLLGIGGVIPTAEYKRLFRNSPLKNFDVPYFLMFYGLMAGILSSLPEIQNAIGATTERVDFVFDDQPGQMERALNAWAEFKEVAPENIKPLLGDPPIFRSDLMTLPLQAADLYAWHLRRQQTVEFTGEQYQSPWGNAGDTINTANWLWTTQNLEAMRDSLDEARRFGVPAQIWPK